jgi:Flp pilus assembly protein TadB
MFSLQSAMPAIFRVEKETSGDPAMRDPENAFFAVIFIAACAFTAAQVEGLIAKLWFILWAISILTGAAWFYKQERKRGKEEAFHE